MRVDNRPRVRIYPLLSLLAVLLVGASPPALADQATGEQAANFPGEPASSELQLHVPSPDWRDQVIYFLMIDRFDDGDPSNNNQGAGEFDPVDGAKYSGGDIPGVLRRLDYIQQLGATALWMTPPVRNRWWDASVNYGGYHGYWTDHFMQIDPHVGSLLDYQRLSDGLHRRGMYLIHDVVVSHVGNYFRYDENWDPNDPVAGFHLNPEANGNSAPSQSPLDQNDPRIATHREANIYHWNPNISDYNNPDQVLNYQMAGLDDLNTENVSVRRVLRQSHGYWIKEVGVDAFRVDTAFHAPVEFFEDFLYSQDPLVPSIMAQAEATGRKNFHVFGEGFAMDRAGEIEQSQRIANYIRGPQGQQRMAGMINFPLYGTLVDVFSRGRPPSDLAHRIDSVMQLFPNPHLMPTFVDNHDVERFLAGGSEAALKQALLMIFTLPGIPTIYYGTEQGFREARGAMFAGGHASGGRDHFDSSAPLFKFIQSAIALRRDHRLFSRGLPSVLAANAAAPGALAYRMQNGDEQALVALNTADHETLLDIADTGLPTDSVLTGLFAIEGEAPTLRLASDGRLSLALPPRSGMVWRVEAAATESSSPAPSIELDALPEDAQRDDFEVGGRAEGIEQFLLVVDGDLGSAAQITPASDGRWSARIDTRAMIDPSIKHHVVAWSRQGAISAQREFRVHRPWTVLVEQADPAGDDHGPTGKYRYPSDGGWGEHRQLDLRGIRVASAGGALKIDLAINAITRGWNPPNGFDRVTFTLFLQMPDQPGGSTLMPLQNATLPEGMRWHYRLRANGWTNAWFAADGASATSEGRVVTPGASISVDVASNTVSFLLPGAATGNRSDWSGVKLYVNTWDYDAGYKGLTPSPTVQSFGGGDFNRDPLWLDHSGVITLP